MEETKVFGPAEQFKEELEALLKKYPTVMLNVQHQIHISEALPEKKEETKDK